MTEESTPSPSQIKRDLEIQFPRHEYAGGREFSDLYFKIVNTPIAKKLFFPEQSLSLEAQHVIDGDRALRRIPEGKKGIVLGSGNNSEVWRRKGWNTLDIDPDSGADIIHDANSMSQIVPPNTQDYVYAEYIRFDPASKEGVGWGTLLAESNKVLRPGGKIIIDTVDMPNNMLATLPDKGQFKRMMIRHGLYPITVGRNLVVTDNNIEQPVRYYGVKYANGYDVDRGKLPNT